MLVLAAAAVAAKSLWYTVHVAGSKSSSVAGLGLAVWTLRLGLLALLLLRAAATVSFAEAGLRCAGRLDRAAGVSEVPCSTFSLSICVLRCLAGPKDTGTCTQHMQQHAISTGQAASVKSSRQHPVLSMHSRTGGPPARMFAAVS